MDLKEFIKDTILQLVQGVIESQEKASKEGAIIMPPKIWTPDASSFRIAFEGERGEEIAGRYVTFLQYDVGVQVTEETGSAAKVTVVAGLFGFGKVEGGVQGKSSHEKETAHRLQFEIPVALPIPGATSAP